MAASAPRLKLDFPGIAPSTERLECISATELAERSLDKKQPLIFEAQSAAQGEYVDDCHKNAFVGAVVMAFTSHLPLELKADHFWLLVLQGISKHVGLHAEQLRSKFVNHAGKKELIVFADDFVLGNPTNDWPRLFPEFVEQINANTVAGVVPRLESTFSTTTPTDAIAGKITLMDVCKSFFSYTVVTRCGFPSVTLHGTRADWVQLHENIAGALALCEPGFASGWGAALASVTAKFVSAFDGERDEDFWQSMAKAGGTTGSGARTWYTGWINTFFPFQDGRNGNERNPFCAPYRPDAGYVKAGLKPAFYGFGQVPLHDVGDMTYEGLEPQSYPVGWAETPAKWDYMRTPYALAFRAGFVGITQDPATLAVTPAVGWVVLRSKEPAAQA